jgi:NADP-dependent 3-hydroxy acid dehydrogenase YdfG
MNMLDGQVAIGTGGVAASGVLPRASSPKRARSSSGPGAVPLDGLGGQIVGAGGRAVAHRADIARPAEACALALATLGRFGRVDVLGNNAGLSSKVRNIQWVHETAWESVRAVNLTGMYRAHPGRPPGHAGPAGGTVVTVSSAAAIRPGLRGGAPYGAAKAAARNLMGHVHAARRNQGIRATTILPAEVDTPILANRPVVPDTSARATMMQLEDVARAILLCLTLPTRTVVEEMMLSPTVSRDLSGELEAARRLGAP